MTVGKAPPRHSGLPPFSFNRQRLVQYFFFAAFMLLLWQVIRILSPFYLALIGSGLLALLVYPLHERLLSRMKKQPSLAAGISTTAVVLMVIAPLILFGWIAAKETAKVYPVAQRWVRDATYFQSDITLKLPSSLLSLWDRASGLIQSWKIDPKDFVLHNVDEASRKMTGLATVAIRNTLFMTFNLLVLTFTLFFFLRDGPYIIRRGMELVPMAPSNKAAVLDSLRSTLYAVLRGVFVVALLQGVLAGLGFAMFGVPFPVLLGMLTSFFGVIPFIGPAAIWVPVVIGLIVNGSYNQAIFVFCWGALVVSVVDNFLRPILISQNSKLPVLLLFFGLVGGLRVYGFSGLLLGPVMIALLLAFINIYRREYHWLLNPGQK